MDVPRLWWDTYIRATRPLAEVGDKMVDTLLPRRMKLEAFDPNYKLHRYQKLAQERQTATASSPAASEWYHYEPLQERQIRLLRLHPASSADDAIAVTLTTESLDSLPSYEALSYTWGDPTNPLSISCDGKAIPATRNLFEALQHLRHPDLARVLWIDAVCINQGDVAERGAQVRLMRDIYQRAASVVVWLGGAGQDSPAAFALLRQLHAAAEAATPADREGTMTRAELSRLGLPDSQDDAWMSLDTLYSRPWFARVWIIQEVALAADAVVWCGNDRMPWPAFATVSRYLYRRPVSTPVGVDVTLVLGLEDVRTALRTSDPPPSPPSPPPPRLLDLLARFRRSLSTNPADKVYALLGLASDSDRELVRVDYSLPVQEAYRQVAAVFLQHESLKILSLVGDPSWKCVDDLPSWVPDWSSTLREYPYLFTDLRDEFQAWDGAAHKGGESDAGESAARFSVDGRTLKLRGITLDGVRATGGAFLSPKVDPHKITTRIVGPSSADEFSRVVVARRLRSWEQMVRGLARYPTGDDVESVFQRLLVGGARVVVPPAEPAATATGGNDGDDNDGVATMAQLYAAFRRHHMMLPGESTRTGPVGHLPWDETMALAAPYGLSARRAAYGRTLFTTRKGYAGLGPRSTKAGDSVVLLRGGRTAYVLRKGGKKRPGIYTFLGEAYVHGLMRGEGVRGGSDLEDFEIV